MPPVNRRLPAASSQAPRGRGAPAASSGYRGSAGLAKMQEEQERGESARAARQAMGHMPFRFRMAPGESKEFIIVDDRPDWFRYEHNLQDREGRWTVYTPCIDEHDNCPICSMPGAKPKYFAMFLTIIDLTPYTSRSGEEVPWSKKLLVVKPGQQKKITRMFERQGTLRGAYVQTARDGDKDASIGNDMELMEMLSEDDLLQYEAQITTADNKVIDVIGHEPFDYDALFPAQTAQQLAAIAGTRTNSYQDHDRAIGRGRGAEPHHDGSDGYDSDDPVPAPRAAPRPSARPAAQAARPVSRPAARPAPRRMPHEDDPSTGASDEPPVEEERPRRVAPPTARTPARPAPALRRAAPANYRDQDVQDPEQEDPPQRVQRAGGVSLADRRAQLRGGR